jgi:phosphate transport system substrate-binding protein
MLSLRLPSALTGLDPAWRRRGIALAGALGASLVTASVALASVPAFPLNLTIGGSTTVFPTANGVATGPYAAQFSDVTIAGGVTQPGSGVGIANLLCGTSDVADASRPLQASDDTATTACAVPHPFQTGQVDQWVIGKDGITIIVHCDTTNCVTGVPGLTRQNLHDIYACTATNWMAFGGPNQTIVAESREITSGTYGDFMGFIGLSVAGGTPPFDGPCVVRQQGNPGMQSAVSTTAWSIAYVGFGFSTGASNLSVLPVSNNTTPPVFVTPSVTTVENATYPFARQLFEMTLKFGALPASGQRLDNYARAINFVNTTASLAGQTIENNDGEFTLTTPPSENPVTAGTCTPVGSQTVCPQTIPPWDVNVDGTANVNDFVLVGQVFLDNAGAGHGGWERQDVTSQGTVNVNSMVNIGQHFLQTWVKWTH